MFVRDPVHGDIALTPEEVRIIDTPTMQRLRGIKQLGTAYLVYPGGVHTRFDHALGTLATTARLLDQIRRGSTPVSRGDERIVRIAALVHDVTHVPFGHTFEDERKLFPRHDGPRRTTRFLTETPLGDVLHALGVQNDVLSLLTDAADWRSDIIRGTIDADLLDYLKRDAYFTGISQRYDDRVFAYFGVDGGRLTVNLTKNGLERPDARSEMVHLLRLRYFLTERIYFHHTKVIAGAMISKALEGLVAEGLSEEALYTFDDAGLLRYLSEASLPASRALAQRVLTRQLYKRAYVLSYDDVSPHEQARFIDAYHHDARARSSLERTIAEEAAVKPEDVIVYVPAGTTLKEGAMPARFPTGVHSLTSHRHRYLDLAALAEQHQRLWRFWVFASPPSRDRVGQAARRVMNGQGRSFGSE